MFYDINKCELSIANVGGIRDVSSDEATLLIGQRKLDIYFKEYCFFFLNHHLIISLLLLGYR